VVKHLSAEAKQQEVRHALKEMIQEVRKSYDIALDVFTPLYNLDIKQKFTAQFSQTRTDFKTTYLKDINNVQTHCSIVAQELKKLEKQKGWMKKPYIRRSFKRLENLAGDWIADDTWLASNMENLLKNLNKFLNEVSRLQKGKATNAFHNLGSSPDQFEDDFLAIKNRLDELTVISSQLKTGSVRTSSAPNEGRQRTRK
jgi:hypothetical protein